MKHIFLGLVMFLCCIHPSYGQHKKPGLKATANSHGAVFNWTASTTPNTTTNILCGTSSGNYNSTPINSTPIPNGTTTFSWSPGNLQAGQQEFCVLRACIGVTCSSNSTPETTFTIPFNSTDIAPPTNVTVTPN